MSTKDTSWITVGTAVLVVGGRELGDRLSLTRTTIEKVNLQTFRVAGNSSLFSRDNQMERTAGYHMDRVVDASSAEAKALWARKRRQDAEDRLDAAHAAWRKDKTSRDKLDAIREAVNKLDQEIERVALLGGEVPA
jgi:hypothetical protein